MIARCVTPARSSLLAASVLAPALALMVLPKGRADAPPNPLTMGAAAPASGTAAAALLRQASFWADHGNPEQARASLARLLTLDPHQPQALALQARLAGKPGGEVAVVQVPDGMPPPAVHERLAERADAAAERAQGAQALREQAQQSPDQATRIALLHAAVAAGVNPWIRLDLARALTQAGQLTDARATMAEGLKARPGGAAGMDTLRAGIIFANETQDRAAATALYAAWPREARPPDLRAAPAHAALRRAIATSAGLDRDAARTRLLTLAAAPDPDGTRGVDLAHALQAAGQPEAAAQALSLARAATPGAALTPRIAYAQALLEAGDTAGARRMLVGLPARADLSPAQRADLTRLQADIGVHTAQALNAQGRQAAGYDVLAPLLASHPDDADLNTTLSDLYLGAHRPHEALALDLALLRRDAGNAALRQHAVDAALAGGERSLAAQLVRDGVREAPDDARTWVASASLARAGGLGEDALHDLQRARDLNGKALAAIETDGPDWTPSPAQPRPLFSVAPPEEWPARPLPVDLSASDAEPGSDADPIVITGHMLDTDATDLPPPSRAVTSFATARPGGPFNMQAPRRPTSSPVMMAADATSGEVMLAHGQLSANADDTGPFGRPDAMEPPRAIGPNPFRSMVSVAPDAAPVGSGEVSAEADAGDPLTKRIDHDIAALSDPGISGGQAAGGFRGRSGAAGRGQLAEISVPLEARFSPDGQGQIGLAVTPTFLAAGTLSQDVGARSGFGTLALGATDAGRLPGSKDAEGTGLDLSYSRGNLTADIGTTPLGFAQQNLVGGVEWVPTLGDSVRLRLKGEQRAVIDSVLSYAGATDARTGQAWGGVAAKRGRANLEFTWGAAELYVGGGGGVLEGRRVRRNTQWEAGAGGSVALLRTTRSEMRLGLDLIYFGYGKNLGGFTLGQGGYFSPQSYFAALLPVTFKQQVSSDLSIEVGATLGLQSYRKDRSDIFPNDAQLQSALVAQQANPATAIRGVATSYPSRHETGFAGGARGLIDYRLTPAFHLGAKVEYEHAGDYNQTAALAYGRYLFGAASRGE